eukprot:scaffold28929_cov71-Cyclotella_meneghiniana.AAC.12
MSDDIESSDSDYDNPYTETALSWHQRSLHRLARKRCGIDSDDGSSDSDDSLDDHDHNHLSTENGSIILPFDRWMMKSYSIVAARCSLFIRDGTFRKNVRDREGKRLRRVLRKSMSDNNTTTIPTDAHNNASNGQSDNPVAVSNNEEIIKHHQLVIDSILPKGVGVKFIDEALKSSNNVGGRTMPPPPSSSVMSNNGQKKMQTAQTTTTCQTVLEINGPARSGLTSILIAVAARYVANTSHLFFDHQYSYVNNTRYATTEEGVSNSPNTVIDPDNSTSNKRRLVIMHHEAITLATKEPRVVILDLEHGIHTMKLILSVREAVLRRWEETSLARKWKWQQHHHLNKKQTEGHCNNNNINNDNANDEIDAIREQQHIERIIASCLGRIHIVQPRDFTYLSLVATIESLNKRLEDDKLLYRTSSNTNSNADVMQQSSQQQPPTMLLIDSLSTLEACTKAQEAYTAAYDH